MFLEQNSKMHRQERLASFIKKEMSSFLENSIDRGEGVFLSVMRVDVDGALEQAKIFVSVYPASAEKDVWKILKTYEKAARQYLAPRLRRHKIPKIIFIKDSFNDSEIKLEKLLEKVKNE